MPMRMAGYAAIFDAPDSGGDIIRRGAFARAAKAGLPLLLQHDPARRIGFVERLEEDGRGQRVIATLDDAQFDVEDWLAGEIAAEFAKAEGSAFVNGNGTDKPKGFLTGAVATAGDASRAFGTLQYVASGAAGSFAASNQENKLIELVHALRERHGLPFLVTAQAQKDITHNEALLLIDALLHPIIQAMIAEPPALDESDAGKCWLVAESAIDAWSGQDNKMACQTGGSWRFLAMPIGFRVFDISSLYERRLTGSGWASAPEIAGFSGDAVIDSQAREVIELLLEHFRAVGVVASGA